MELQILSQNVVSLITTMMSSLRRHIVYTLTKFEVRERSVFEFAKHLFELLNFLDLMNFDIFRLNDTL